MSEPTSMLIISGVILSQPKVSPYGKENDERVYFPIRFYQQL